MQCSVRIIPPSVGHLDILKLLVAKFGKEIVSREDNRATKPVFFAAQQGMQIREMSRRGERERGEDLIWSSNAHPLFVSSYADMPWLECKLCVYPQRMPNTAMNNMSTTEFIASKFHLWCIAKVHATFDSSNL